MKRVVAGVLLLTAWLWASDKAEVSPQLEELANAERKFAALGAEVGVRDSFLQFFAEDAIFFGPAPGLAVPDLRKQPPAPKPLPFRLQWEPMTGEISADGEFGYLTGPTLTTDLTEQKRPPRHGVYFSVWQKIKGEWKVIADGGVGMPGPVAEIGKIQFRRNAPSGAQVRAAGTGNQRQTLEQAEAEFARAIAADGPAAAFNRLAAPHARLYRGGQYPIEGTEEIAAYLSKNPDVVSPKVQGGGTSNAGDLAYSYGAYEGTPNYFMRVWKRSDAGNWQIVYDILYAPPPPRPQPAASN